MLLFKEMHDKVTQCQLSTPIAVHTLPCVTLTSLWMLRTIMTINVMKVSLSLCLHFNGRFFPHERGLVGF